MESKMYILIRDKVPAGLAINSAAHASLACYLKYKDDPRMVDWLANSFKKVTCKVTDEEFAKAMKLEDDFVILTESSLGGEVTCVTFCPRDNYKCFFKFLKLFGDS